MAVGAFLVFLVPSQLATPTSQNFSHQQDDSITSQIGNATFKTRFCNWQYKIYRKFLLLYGCVISVCITILAFTLTFGSDYPKKPPTVTKILVRVQNNHSQHKNILKTSKNYISITTFV